jgi:hypothetical protein
MGKHPKNRQRISIKNTLPRKIKQGSCPLPGEKNLFVKCKKELFRSLTDIPRNWNTVFLSLQR